MLCGATSLVGLVCFGSCLDVSLTCVLVGAPLERLGVMWFGKLCLFAFFGQYGRRETIGISRIWEALRKLF
jgi:hypothetical protein